MAISIGTGAARAALFDSTETLQQYESNSINPDTDSDSLVVVLIGAISGNLSLPIVFDSLTFGTAARSYGTGTAMTIAANSTNNDNRSHAVIAWLKTDATGTVQIDSNINLRGVIIDVIQLKGVDQTDPVPTSAEAQPVSSSGNNISITTAHANSWIVAESASMGDDSGPPNSTNGTNLHQGSTGSTTASDEKDAASYRLVVSAGSTTANFTWGSSTQNSQAVIEVKAASDLFFKAINIAFITAMANTPVKTGVKALNVGFATAMANTPVKIGVKAINVTFETAMAVTRVKSFFRTINVAFETAINVIKTTKRVITVAFVTSMSQSLLKTFFKSIAVGFASTFTVVKKVSATKAIQFVTSMGLTTAKITVKAIAFTFSTVFTLAKTVKVTKTVTFGTTMALTKIMSFFRTIAVAFGTAFANVRKTRLTKAISFVTTFSLATLFSEASQTFTKTINVVFATSMNTTSTATFFKALNVAFVTAMSLAKTVKKNIAVAFVTAFVVARKTSATKTVAFVTAFALTPTAMFPKALSVSFITTMVTTQFLTAFKVFDVAFVTSMSLVKRVLKTFTVGFSTGFGLAKKILVTKPVAFVTSMTRTTALGFPLAAAFSFVTTMVTTPAGVFLKSIAVGFGVVFTTATQFTVGIMVPIGAMLLFMRRRRWGRDRR